MAKRGLGKGLDAIFGDISSPAAEEGEALRILKLTEIEPNRNQPRKEFNEEQLLELAESIKIHGLIQPIIVSPLDNGFYQIIAGERRWRASRMAGLKEIPAVVREIDAQERMEVALIENLQREDLNPVEEAEGYRQLMDSFSLTQEQVSDKVGKSRSAVANALRILALSGNVLEMLKENKISSGHARAILSLKDENMQLELAQKVVDLGLSVRETESLAKHMKDGKSAPKKQSIKIEPHILDLQKRLSDTMGTKVKICPGKNKGKIEIEYYDDKQLEYIIGRMK